MGATGDACADWRGCEKRVYVSSLALCEKAAFCMVAPHRWTGQKTKCRGQQGRGGKREHRGDGNGEYESEGGRRQPAAGMVSTFGTPVFHAQSQEERQEPRVEKAPTCGNVARLTRGLAVLSSSEVQPTSLMRFCRFLQ